MALMEWQDSYSVGVEVLDADHKRLIDIINRVDDAEKANISVQWALQELDNYARYHFRREEERMEAVDYPGLDAHVKEHEAFIEWLETVKRTYGVAPEAHFYLAQTVNSYLKQWLTNHILKTDMQYKGAIS